MPSPCAMPSQGATVLNSTGMPPASRTPCLMLSAIPRKWMCPGVVSLHEFATAMRGLARSSRE